MCGSINFESKSVGPKNCDSILIHRVRYIWSTVNPLLQWMLPHSVKDSTELITDLLWCRLTITKNYFVSNLQICICKRRSLQFAHLWFTGIMAFECLPANLAINFMNCAVQKTIYTHFCSKINCLASWKRVIVVDMDIFLLVVHAVVKVDWGRSRNGRSRRRRPQIATGH